MICVVELDAIAIDEADGCVRTESWDRELFQEVPSDLKICVLLMVGLVGLRSPCRNFAAGVAWGRLVVRLGRLSGGFVGLVRRPLQG